MQRYHEVTGNHFTPLKEPKLSDFYNPSRQQKDSEIALGIGMTLVGIFLTNIRKLNSLSKSAGLLKS